NWKLETKEPITPSQLGKLTVKYILFFSQYQFIIKCNLKLSSQQEVNRWMYNVHGIRNISISILTMQNSLIKTTFLSNFLSKSPWLLNYSVLMLTHNLAQIY